MRAAEVRVRFKGTQVYVKPVGSAYEAAGGGRRAKGWAPSAYGPNGQLLYALDPLQRRSRDAIRNIGLAEAAADVLVSNLVGTGIKPQFQTGDDGLNKELAELWLEWTDEADADGQLDFYGMMALAVRSMVEAGEVFTRKRLRRQSDGLSVPLQLQLIESEFCPPTENRTADNGNEIRMGIEVNAIGQRQAYWFYKAHPQDWPLLKMTDQATLSRVPADSVIHLREIKRPGMMRGVPWLTQALVTLRDLDAYDDAELMRMRTTALFAGFIKREPPETDEAVIGEEQQSDGSFETTLQPATMQMLDEGEDVTFSKPPEVGNNYQTFIRTQQRKVATSARVLYEQLTGDYQTINDRTFRAAVNEFRRQATMLQHHLVVFQWCRGAMGPWLDSVFLNDIVRLPASVNELLARRVRWVPQGWDYINPVQEVQADRLAVRAGFKSRTQVVAAAGDDISQVDAEIQRDNVRADSLGLVLDSDPRKVSGAGLTQARPAGSEIPGEGGDQQQEQGDGGKAED